jgi:sulfur carrier protein
MTQIEQIEIQLNGQARAVAEASSVADLLEQLELIGKRVAVERNGEIVTRSLHAQTLLQQGDHLEIVQAIGGG